MPQNEEQIAALSPAPPPISIPPPTPPARGDTHINSHPPRATAGVAALHVLAFPTPADPRHERIPFLCTAGRPKNKQVLNKSLCVRAGGGNTGNKMRLSLQRTVGVVV